MAHKHLLFRAEARDKILRGVNAITDAMRVTLGPKSKSVFTEILEPKTAPAPAEAM